MEWRRKGSYTLDLATRGGIGAGRCLPAAGIMVFEFLPARPLGPVKVGERVCKTATLAETHPIAQAEVLVCCLVSHADVISAVVKWELLQV